MRGQSAVVGPLLVLAHADLGSGRGLTTKSTEDAKEEKGGKSFVIFVSFVVRVASPSARTMSLSLVTITG